MYAKPPLRYLNLGPYPPHPTNTYTYRMTIIPMVCSGIWLLFWLSIFEQPSINSQIV